MTELGREEGKEGRKERGIGGRKGGREEGKEERKERGIGGREGGDVPLRRG